VTFHDIVEAQLGAKLPGLAGTAAHATIRVSEVLLNQSIAAALPPTAPVKMVTAHPRADNGFDVSVALRKPAFLPPLHAHLSIERQPTLPADPILVLRLGGGAASLLKMAGPFLGGSLPLPPGIRLQDDHLFVDLRALAAARGQEGLLDYVTELHVATEDGALVVRVAGAIGRR
jgi:hypothetical protein